LSIYICIFITASVVNKKIQSILDTPEIVSEIKEIVRNHNDSKIVLKLMRDKYFLNTKEAILVLKRIKEEKK